MPRLPISSDPDFISTEQLMAMSKEELLKLFPNAPAVIAEIRKLPWNDQTLDKALNIATNGQIDLLSFIEQDGGDDLVEIRTRDIKHAAKLWTQRAVIGAQEVVHEAEEAERYLDPAFNERRRTQAQEAQQAANNTKENAKAAEEALAAGDYDTAIAMGRAAHDYHNTAIKAARRAAVDDNMPGMCPHCMTFNGRFGAKGKYTKPLADGTGRAELLFTCISCHKNFTDFFTYEVWLLDRIKE
jgi:hypothetical protein